MLENLWKVFTTDNIVPSTSVFPAIDVQLIARKLNIVKSASLNSSNNLPDSASTTMDSIELDIVTEVSKLRWQGLENYENNLDVYNERLSRATDARKEVVNVVDKAKGDFKSDILALESELVESEEKVRQSYEFLQDFKNSHNLIRPAEDRSPTVMWVGLIMLALLVESILNGVLFAQKNELGLFGGVMIAVLISIANVGLSSILGYYSRFIYSVKFFSKIWGLMFIVVWIGLVAAFNFAVAHFRDALQTVGDWSVATTVATSTLIELPLGIASIESWLLVVLGFLISLGAFLKAYYVDDSYPRYGKFTRMLSKARVVYTENLNTVLSILEDRRDKAIQDFKEADQFVNQEISEALDALSGKSTLRSQLDEFLQLCELSANQLLKQYRDRNRTERRSDAPAYFDENFKFDEYISRMSSDKYHDEAMNEKERVTETVEKACHDIHQEYLDSVDKFKSIRGLQDALADRPADRIRIANTAGLK